MGKLRKIGKSIKKKVGKLMGGKFGKIIGGIGLAMMFWGGANALFGNTKWFSGLKTKLSSMNPFAKPDISSAVSEVTVEPSAFESKLASASDKVVSDASSKIVGDPSKFERFVSGDLSKIEALDTAKFSELNTMDKIAKVGVEGANLAYEAGEAVGEAFIPDKGFVKDTAEALTMAGLSNAIAGDEEAPAVTGRSPAFKLDTVRGQQAFVSEVRNQISNIPATNFNQMNDMLIHGTLSPSYLSRMT